ncbi:MAG: rRNA maturation RNase YbeY, partial [Mariprofundaceae bacterium]
MAIEMMVDEGVPGIELPAREQLSAAVMAACRASGLDDQHPIEVCLRFSSDATVRDANKQWRGKDAVTDVLSFPMQESPYRAGEPLGDIMLAWPRLSRDAAELGVPPRAHACHLAIHGVLHLLGYTHDDDTEADRMQACERMAMREAGL